eukprot:9491981-Pyramimonas_sp.AAC.1
MVLSIIHTPIRHGAKRTFIRLSPSVSIVPTSEEEKGCEKTLARCPYDIASILGWTVSQRTPNDSVVATSWFCSAHLELRLVVIKSTYHLHDCHVKLIRLLNASSPTAKRLGLHARLI